MEQAKALNALEPFLALSKSATSPRAAADLITRATSSPNTYLFTELLETPQIQALTSSSSSSHQEFAPHFTLLQIFSHGTYATYASTPGLPPLNDAQALKLRQLSLLTLARGAGSGSGLGYDALMRELGLATARQLEDTVISAVYAGLVAATLDPARRAVRVSSVAPLRDLAPGAVPGMVAALRAWSGRCEATLQGLEAQIAEVRADAARRAAEKSAWDERLAALVEEEKRASEKGPGGGGAGSRKSITLTTGHGHVPGSGGGGGRAPRFGKRGSNVMMEGSAEDIDDEAMDVDDSDDEVDGKKRASRRKL